MIVFLTSSPTGPLDGSRPVEGIDEMNGFRERLHQYWRRDARVLMISATPDDPVDNDSMGAWMADTLTKSGLTWSCVELWDRRTVDFSAEALKCYDVIFLGGGHVPTQNRFFEQIGLRETIRGFAGLVIGISAGTMNSADEVYAQPELSGEAKDPQFQRWLRGLALTKTQILPHYQMVKDWYLDGMRLFEEITYADSRGHSFLALHDGSYLLVENGCETVYGDAWEICDGLCHRICRQDHSRLLRSAQ